MGYIRCDAGEDNDSTFIVKRYYGESYSGNATATKDMRLTLFIDVDSSYLSYYNFKINNTSILTTLTNNIESHHNRSNGWGYTLTHFNMSSGDVLSWNLGSTDFDFVIFNE